MQLIAQHHPATRKAHHVPPRHEARDARTRCVWCPGIKIASAGRLERHRNRAYRVVSPEGRALCTLKADIDYGFSSEPRPPTASSASGLGLPR